MVYGLLIILLISAIIKILLLKRSVREIKEGFADRLKKDTNTVIDTSSRDKDICELASSSNEQLRILRR